MENLTSLYFTKKNLYQTRGKYDQLNYFRFKYSLMFFTPILDGSTDRIYPMFGTVFV